MIPGEDESISRRVVERVRRERNAHPEAVITAILADRVSSRSILAPFIHRHSLAIKSRLLFEPYVVVTDLNVLRRSRRSLLPQVPISRIELCGPDDDILLISRKGQAIRFRADDGQLRPMGGRRPA